MKVLFELDCQLYVFRLNRKVCSDLIRNFVSVECENFSQFRSDNFNYAFYMETLLEDLSLRTARLLDIFLN